MNVVDATCTICGREFRWLTVTARRCEDCLVTRRERDILALLAHGMTNQEIAEALCIQKDTVENHIANIFKKLEVSTRTAAARYAWEHGIGTES
jgi:DNA-binding NarL/FixJ family response regulator